MAALDVLVGRQPIRDAHDCAVGFELLFRSLDEGDVRELDGDLLTSTVILGAATIGLDRIVGDRLAFVNADSG